MIPNFRDHPELLMCSSLVILHKSTLPAVQRTSRRLQDEDKSDLWAPWVMSLHLPAAHPPNAPESTGNGNRRKKCLGMGLRLQMRSFWMLQNREQGFQELFDIKMLGKTPPNNHGTVLYGFVQNPSLLQNWISRARRCVTNTNFSCFSKDQGSCSSFPKLNMAKSMWLNEQYRSFIMSNWFLIMAADNPLVKLPVMGSWTARRQLTAGFNKPITCLAHLLTYQLLFTNRT